MHPSSPSPAFSVGELRARARTPFAPTIVDVRRRAAFERDPVRIPMALRFDPEDVDRWAARLDAWRPVVAYCVHGHEVGRGVAEALRSRGFDAIHLEGGLERWREHGGPVEPWSAPTRWVTRARPKIDRLACPWLIRRFIDASAEFFYVDAQAVASFAELHDAVPFDVPGAAYTHAGDRCSFDAFVSRHAPDDEALRALADVVRAADTDTLARSPVAPGLLAVSLGMGRGITDDQSLLRHAMIVYDALYAWCSGNAGARHGADRVAGRS